MNKRKSFCPLVYCTTQCYLVMDTAVNILDLRVNYEKRMTHFSRSNCADGYARLPKFIIQQLSPPLPKGSTPLVERAGATLQTRNPKVNNTKGDDNCTTHSRIFFFCSSKFVVDAGTLLVKDHGVVGTSTTEIS